MALNSSLDLTYVLLGLRLPVLFLRLISNFSPLFIVLQTFIAKDTLSYVCTLLGEYLLYPSGYEFPSPFDMTAFAF